MTKNISLNGLKMNAVQTAPNGVINHETYFDFHQDNDQVWAEYSGGKIVRAYLVGLLTDSILKFRYCQLESSGQLNGGHSECEVQTSGEGLIQIVEHFEWESQPGGGVNIIQEIQSKQVIQGSEDYSL